MTLKRMKPAAKLHAKLPLNSVQKLLPTLVPSALGRDGGCSGKASGVPCSTPHVQRYGGGGRVLFHKG